MKIVYKDIEIPEYDKTNRSLPLRYRVKLCQNNNGDFQITRKYFKTGFRDGEIDDEIFIPKYSYIAPEVEYVSIMTKNVDDKKYLKYLEKLVIQTYKEECEIIIPKLKNELNKRINDYNQKIENAKKSLIFLSNYNRREKLKNINKNQNEKTQ